MENYITVESYNGKLVQIPEEKKREYLEKQEIIKKYIQEGKTQEEILKLMK